MRVNAAAGANRDLAATPTEVKGQRLEQTRVFVCVCLFVMKESTLIEGHSEHISIEITLLTLSISPFHYYLANL